jgi:hypothetical protein
MPSPERLLIAQVGSAFERSVLARLHMFWLATSLDAQRPPLRASSARA